MTFYVFLSCCTRFPEQWLTECETIDGRRSDHYFSIQKRVHTSGVRAVLNA